MNRSKLVPDKKNVEIHARAVTSKDVAREAGVSQSTVSLVLSGRIGVKIRPETRARVLDVAIRLGYRTNLQASAMKRRRAGAIGLLSTWETGSFVFAPVVNGLKALCDREGLALIICTGRTEENGMPDYVAYYLENRLDGLVYLSYVGVAREGVIETLQAYRIPFSCAIGARDLPEVPSVDVDFLENGRLAARHLLAEGCRHVAIANDPEMNDAEQERREGFVEVCREAGCRVTCFSPWSDGMEPARIRAVLSRQLESFPDLDGFTAVSQVAWMMLQVARDRGVNVPEQLKVVSLDNESWAPWLTPALTTVDEPLEDIGRVAGELLLTCLGEDITEENQEQIGAPKIALLPGLSIRESSTKATGQ